MSSEVRPEHGGRVELRRADAQRAPDATRDDFAPVVFQAIWSTRSGAWRGQVAIHDGRVSLTVTGSNDGQAAPPTWLTDWTLQLVRTALRSATLDPSGELPRRFTRWRAAPEER